MYTLAELQSSFCDALRTPEAADPELLNQLLDDGLAQQRFLVYRNNFIVLNGDAVADMYPVVKRLVGDDAFRVLATAYVRKHPPLERTLLLYGERFPDFLASIPELSALPYLRDVARLEFAWTTAYHAMEAGALKPEQFSTLSNESFSSLKLSPHPSIQLLESPYPVYRIWTANQSDQPDELIALDEGPSRLVVIRPDQDVQVREVGLGEFHFIQALCDSDTIGNAYEHALSIDPEFDLQRFIQQHLLDGTFSSLR
jgi:hypothetical protein